MSEVKPDTRLLTDGKVDKSDNELLAVYQKVKKEAYEFSERYHSAVSSDNFNPDRPADRERYFIIAYLDRIQKETSQAQLVKDKKFEQAEKERIFEEIEPKVMDSIPYVDEHFWIWWKDFKKREGIE